METSWYWLTQVFLENYHEMSAVVLRVFDSVLILSLTAE